MAVGTEATAAIDVLDVSKALRIFLAGGVGCSLSHALATPLDVVKTRQQMDRNRYRDERTGKPLGTIATAIRIANQEGPGMLLQGLRSTVLGYLAQGAMKYGCWEIFKACLGYSTAAGVEKVCILVVAAFGADVMASLVLNPFERARIRLVSDPSYATSLTQTLRQLVRDDGVINGLYGSGLAATMLKQQAYTIAKLTVFTLVFESL